jgi:hypothetical protein
MHVADEAAFRLRKERSQSARGVKTQHARQLSQHRVAAQRAGKGAERGRVELALGEAAEESAIKTDANGVANPT